MYEKSASLTYYSAMRTINKDEDHSAAKNETYTIHNKIVLNAARTMCGLSQSLNLQIVPPPVLM